MRKRERESKEEKERATVNGCGKEKKDGRKVKGQKMSPMKTLVRLELREAGSL